MLMFDAKELVNLKQRLDKHLTFIPFFQALSIRPEQERYFLKGNVDGGRTLLANTVHQRRRRYGYYGSTPRAGVLSDRPFGVWTGNTLDHTTKKKARVTIRTGVLTLQHRLKRSITNYWDEKKLDKYVEKAAAQFLGAVTDERRSPPRVIMVRAA